MSKTWDQILDLKEEWPDGVIPDWFNAVVYQSAAENEIARLTAELAQRDKKIRADDAFFKTLTTSDKTIVKLESELAQRDERIRELKQFASDLYERVETFGLLLVGEDKEALDLGVKEASNDSER